MRTLPTLDWRAIRRSITRARGTFPPFGRQIITTASTVKLLERLHVISRVDELPDQLAGLLSPRIGRLRHLTIATHVPHLARRVVQLHEAGHLLQGTAGVGVAYDNDNWRTPTELGADLFAAVGLCPQIAVDLALESHIWLRDVEDDVAQTLVQFAEGMWDEERALVAARHRIMVRERIGV